MSDETQLIDVVQVCCELRITERTLQKMIERGEFPQPFRLGRKKVWLRKIVTLNIEQAAQPKETEEHA